MAVAISQGLPPLVTGWTAFTPTLNDSTNVSQNTGFWRRVGESIEVQGFISWNGTGVGGALAFALPSGLTTDTTKVPATVTNETTTFGIGTAFKNAVGYTITTVCYTTTSTFGLNFPAQGGFVANTYFVNNSRVSYTYSVPISGWTVTV